MLQITYMPTSWDLSHAEADMDAQHECFMLARQHARFTFTMQQWRASCRVEIKDYGVWSDQEGLHYVQAGLEPALGEASGAGAARAPAAQAAAPTLRRCRRTRHCWRTT